MPFFCVSVALEKQVYEGKREVIAAVIEAPALKETYWAERGAGAWLERSDGARSAAAGRLRVAARQKLEDALVSVGCTQCGGQKQEKLLASLKGKISGFRAMGATALELAYVAAGRADLFVQHDERPWDIAAGSLMVREAGGYVTDFRNKDIILQKQNDIVAANDKLHGALLKMVGGA